MELIWVKPEIALRECPKKADKGITTKNYYEIMNEILIQMAFDRTDEMMKGLMR